MLVFLNLVLTRSILRENTRKSLNLQIWIWFTFKILIFYDFSSMGGRVAKRVVKFCHPL